MTNEELIAKYNKPVPRYTSYPPANSFVEMGEEEYLAAVDQSNNAAVDNISFYIHVPFCQHLCHYCGCNSVAMARNEVVEAYFDALHREINLLLPHLDKGRKISQIHYGGGSPTSIPLHHIRRLNEHLLGSFGTIENPEIAIECHPAYLNDEHWEQLIGCGFTRYSLGIQDFDDNVLRTVNRRPSLLPVEHIVERLRQSGAKVNLDFIYGLPGQTVQSFARTIARAIDLRPNRLVTFSYAHVPYIYGRQRILEKAGLPPEAEKMRMFEQAAEQLARAGYCHIGMDHFVEPNDDLQQALERKQLHRNFQGYCPRRITAQVYALGVSGISQLDAAYAQNTKDVARYIQYTNEGRLCIERGYALQPWQRVAREVIESLMCNYYVAWTDMAHRLNISAEEVKEALNYDVPALQQMADDGLITLEPTHIALTEAGSPFVRNVAAALDKMMINNNNRFSKPV